MNRRPVVLIGLMTLILTSVFSAWFLWLRHPTRSMEVINTVRVEVEGTVNLGAVKNGEIVQATIELRNPGNTPVHVGAFRTDCACMQVYQMEGEEKRAVKQILLQPLGKQYLYLDLRVSGDPGKQYASSLSFSDLDSEPGVYQVAVLYTPIARLSAVPRTVAYGVIPGESSVTRRVEIRSDGTFLDSLAGLKCSKPDTFTIAFVPPTREEKDSLSVSSRGQQHLLGYLDITLRTGSQTGSYDDTLMIFKGDEEFLRLGVFAHVETTYSAAPSELILPRVENGSQVYTAKILLHSRSGQQFQIKSLVDNMPFDIKLSDTTGTNSIVATVSYTGKMPLTAKQDFILVFRVTETDSKASTFDLTVPITLLPSS